jgi:hypothetical protein
MELSTSGDLSSVSETTSHDWTDSILSNEETVSMEEDLEDEEESNLLSGVGEVEFWLAGSDDSLLTGLESSHDD